MFTSILVHIHIHTYVHIKQFLESQLCSHFIQSIRQPADFEHGYLLFELWHAHLARSRQVCQHKHSRACARSRTRARSCTRARAHTHANTRTHMQTHASAKTG